MWGKWSTNQRPGYGWSPVEHNQKLIRPEEAHNELIHQICTQSNHGLSINVPKLLVNSETRKQQEFQGSWPKANQAWGA